MSKEQIQPQPDRLPEVEDVGSLAHTPGHFPTDEEITRLERFERRRVQNQEAQKRWRQRYPVQHRQNNLKWYQGHSTEIAQRRAAYYHEYNTRPEVMQHKAAQARERYARKTGKIPDPELVVGFERVSANLYLKDQIEQVLSTFSQRDRDIVRLRLGLADGKDRILEEVGREFGITKARVQQIETKALRQIDPSWLIAGRIPGVPPFFSTRKKTNSSENQ